MNPPRALRASLIGLALAVATHHPVAAQQPDTTRLPTAAFFGRIINSLDSSAVQSADIRLVFIDSVKSIKDQQGRDSLEIFADSTRVRVAVTDSTGSFAIRRLAAGRYLFDVRRIGYEQLHGALTVDSTPLRTTLIMPVISKVLAKVVVTEWSVDKVKQRLDRQGFIERSRLGLAATFVERAEILRRRPQTLEDILNVYGIHSGTITLDHMPIEYEAVRDYPADMVIGIEIYRHSRPTQFNGTRSGPNMFSPGGQQNAMQPLVLVWTFIP